MAITVDDLPFAGLSGDPSVWLATTEALVACFDAHRAPALGFVNEGKLGDPPSNARTAVLRRWVDAGLELGNHTRSHLDLHEVGFEAFAADVRAGDPITRRLLESAGAPRPRFFRHPYLHTGESEVVRAQVDELLREAGYQVAPVTMDNQDYVFARAYDRAAGEEARGAVAEAYLGYMDEVLAYWEQQSRALLGRELSQILLIHASPLNAAVCRRLMRRIEARGYELVPLTEALSDPAFRRREDGYFGPAGISWVHRWALTEGRRGAFFAGEPEPPTEIVASGH